MWAFVSWWHLNEILDLELVLEWLKTFGDQVNIFCRWDRCELRGARWYTILGQIVSRKIHSIPGTSLFGSRVPADVVKIRSHWSLGLITQDDWCLCKRGRHREIHREKTVWQTGDWVTMAETGMACLEAKEHQGLPITPEARRKAWNRFIPGASGESVALRTPYPQPASLQNRVTTSVCGLEPHRLWCSVTAALEHSTTCACATVSIYFAHYKTYTEIF